MVKFLNMKKKIGFLNHIEDPCKVIIKRFKEKRTKILKQSMTKLKKIPDAEQCLRQAVLIRNTFIRTKDLSPKQFERHLLTGTAENLDQNHADLLQGLEHNNNNTDSMAGDRPSSASKKYTTSPSNSDNLHKVYDNEGYSSSDNSELMSVSDSRQLVAPVS